MERDPKEREYLKSVDEREHRREMNHYEASAKRRENIEKTFMFAMRLSFYMCAFVGILLFATFVGIRTVDYMDAIISEKTNDINERSNSHDRKHDKLDLNNKYKHLDGIDIRKARAIHEIYVSVVSIMETGHYEHGRTLSYHYKIDRSSWDDIITKADIDEISSKLKELLILRGYDLRFNVIYNIDSTFTVILDIPQYIEKLDEINKVSNK